MKKVATSTRLPPSGRTTTRAPLIRRTTSEREVIENENKDPDTTTKVDPRDDSLTEETVSPSTAAATDDKAGAKDTALKKHQHQHQQYVKARAADVASKAVLENLGDKGHKMDADRWRKKVGVGSGVKIFIITGVYPDIRDALLRRGWKQNPVIDSPHFDMKWTLKSNEVDQLSLQPHQQANHFAKAGAITTKAGLIHTLRSVHWFTPVDFHTFYPRAYDLGNCDDYADFVDDFRQVEAEKILRQVVVAVVQQCLESKRCSIEDLWAATGTPAPILPDGIKNEVDAANRRTTMLARLLNLPMEALDLAMAHPALLERVRAGTVRINTAVLDAAIFVSRKRSANWVDEQLDDLEGRLEEVKTTADRTRLVASPEFVYESEPAVTMPEWEVLRYCNVFAPGGPSEQAPIKRNEELATKERERLDNIARDKAAKESARKAASEKRDPFDTKLSEDSGCDAGDDDDDDDDTDDGSDDGAPPQPARLVRGFPKQGQAPTKKKDSAENPDDFNSGIKFGVKFRDRGAVAAAQLRMWRERLMREGGDTEIFSDSVGNPPATRSSASEMEFSSLQPLDESRWVTAVRLLGALNAHVPNQVSLNALIPKNIWIVKPAGKSRGRGIECENTLEAILSNRGGDGHKEQAWICQRYIERPLLIKGYKWDIRQWVLVSSWNPLTIWFYDRCYLRFCCYPFELDNLSNRYIHLSNNSIQKYSVAFDASVIEGNMWHAANFAEWLQVQAAQGAWDGLEYVKDEAAINGDCSKPADEDGFTRVPIASCTNIWADVLQPQLRRIVTWSLQAAQERVQPRAGTFEVYGYDFMIDADLHPWLIEINASPDFSYSTAVTETLVKDASEDVMKVVVDYAAWDTLQGKSKKPKEPDATAPDAPDTGGWQCIYKTSATNQALMTCAAHGISLVGTGYKQPAKEKKSALPAVKSTRINPSTLPRVARAPDCDGAVNPLSFEGAGARALMTGLPSNLATRRPPAMRREEPVRAPMGERVAAARSRAVVPLTIAALNVDTLVPPVPSKRSARTTSSSRSLSATGLRKAAV